MSHKKFNEKKRQIVRIETAIQKINQHKTDNRWQQIINDRANSGLKLIKNRIINQLQKYIAYWKQKYYKSLHLKIKK